MGLIFEILHALGGRSCRPMRRFTRCSQASKAFVSIFVSAWLRKAAEPKLKGLLHHPAAELMETQPIEPACPDGLIVAL